jgi:nitrogen fixation protein FixH
MSSAREHDPPRIQGWHVLAGMIGFFGVIFAVNGVFLYQALSTHTGVIANEPYRKGLAYNERIADEERQQALGWREQLTLAPTGDRLTLQLTDGAGRPVRGLRIAGLVGRPSTNEHDIRLDLAEQPTGTYAAAVPPLAAGTWMVSLEASELTAEGERILWRTRTRLWRTP